jgi:hypothetical protein
MGLITNLTFRVLGWFRTVFRLLRLLIWPRLQERVDYRYGICRFLNKAGFPCLTLHGHLQQKRGEIAEDTLAVIQLIPLLLSRLGLGKVIPTEELVLGNIRGKYIHHPFVWRKRSCFFHAEVKFLEALNVPNGKYNFWLAGEARTRGKLDLTLLGGKQPLL